MSLRRRHLVWTAGLLAFSLVGGCTPDLGTPDYSDQVGLREPVDPFPPVPPDPYQPGDDRLSVGYFYETGRSETIPINGVTTNYFIFVVDQNRPGQTLTGSQSDSSDRLEGLISIEFTTTDQPFWGAGILWGEATDLSEWTTMYVGFKSSDESFERFDLTLQSAATLPNEPPPDPRSVVLDPRNYGYTNDGQWHFLRIPLQDAIDLGWDPSNVRSPFIISALTAQAGDQMLIDNLYFTKEDNTGVGGGGGMGGAGGTAGSGGTAGAGGAGGAGGAPDILYEQSFESLDANSATALGDDGWLFFATVFDDGGNPLFPFGPMPAPNATVSPSDTFISAVVTDEGDAPQGTQQLSVFNDYNCCQPNDGHFNGTDRVEMNVFQEINPIPSSFIGRTLEFSFDAKRGNIEGATTASAFITTLDPDAGFSQTNFVPIDMTGIPATWDRYSITLDLTDPLLEGQILQVGFRNTASDFEGSGSFYDNVDARLVGGGGGAELRPLPEIYTTGKAINYSAFRAGGPAAGEIPSDADVLEDLGLLQTVGYDLLRLFGGDAVSEKILQLAEASYPEMQFQQGLFLEGLAGAAAENCDSMVNDSQVETAIRLANTYSNVVTVSVGNETSFFAGFMPLNCLEGYIAETRSNVTQPVTADDDYTFYAGTFARKPDTVLPLLDFVSIHMYPITNYRQWDWKQEGVAAGPLRAEAMMNEALAVAQANYQAVYDYPYNASTIGESLPIVVGETGWKWRQTTPSQEIETYAALPVNAKWYNDLLLTWERSPGGPVTIFPFEAFDEAWKTTDDGWGFWDELRMPNYVLCGTPAGSACNDPLYEDAGYYTP